MARLTGLFVKKARRGSRGGGALILTRNHPANRIAPAARGVHAAPKAEHLMRKISKFALVALVALRALSVLASSDAHAQSNRTFVSGHGSDSSSCTLTAPCRSFAQAVTQTAPGGEITVLDSAGYGPVTITQSVTITNPSGVEAGITAPGGSNAITITAPSTADITLRGLTLLGGGAGANGIVLNSSAGGSLNIIGCFIKDFTASGVAIQPSAGTLTALISDTYALNNGSKGINIAPTSAASVNFAIAQVTAEGNANGIYLDASASNGRVTGVISGSHVDYNSGNGITASGKSGSFNIYVHIKDSYATHNGSNGVSALNTGVSVGFSSGSGILLNNVYALSNSTDIATSSGSSIFTFGNNVFGGTSGGSPTAASLR
jgi:hypothetical protein